MAVIRFLGHAAFEVTNSKGQRIYFDPWITGNRTCPIKLEDITEAAAVFVSHGHWDHVGDSAAIVKATGATLVSTPEMSFFLAKTEGWPYGTNAYPLAPGGSTTIAGMRIWATAALHRSDITWLGWTAKERPYPGGGCALGFVVEVEPGVRVYFAGDTGLFGDMKLIAELYAPTVAIMPIGGRSGMGSREAGIAAGWLKVKAAIPMHYYTDPAGNQYADPAEFVKSVEEKAPGTTAVVMKAGDTYTVDAP